MSEFYLLAYEYDNPEEGKSYELCNAPGELSSARTSATRIACPTEAVAKAKAEAIISNKKVVILTPVSAWEPHTEARYAQI